MSDVYFTNAETGPGYQQYQSGSVYQIAPKVGVFDRARDRKVELVVVLTDGNEHEIQLILTTPAGDQYPATWSVPRVFPFALWRAEGWRWLLSENWMPGRYEVELTMDGLLAGTHSFEVK